MKIQKVLTLSHWNEGLHTPRSFTRKSVPQTYSYREYIRAWYNNFWYQAYNHSWFIMFCKNAYKMNFPLWFQSWWTKFGLSKEIFPLPIQKSFHFFEANIYGTPISITFRFALYFQIPWILCWNFKFGKSGNFKALTNAIISNGGISFNTTTYKKKT